MKTQRLLIIALLISTPVVYADVPVVDSNTPPNKEKVTSALANIAVSFAENRGQADAKVAFQAKTLAGSLFVTKTGELVWSLTNHLHPPHSPLDRREVRNNPPHSPLDRREVRNNPPHSIPPSPVMERGPGGEVEVKANPPHSPLDRREVRNNPPHSPLDRREVKTPNSNPPSPVKERGPGGEVKSYSVVERFVGGTPKPTGKTAANT